MTDRDAELDHSLQLLERMVLNADALEAERVVGRLTTSKARSVAFSRDGSGRLSEVTKLRDGRPRKVKTIMRDSRGRVSGAVETDQLTGKVRKTTVHRDARGRIDQVTEEDA